ncbi:MAG: hypothetical protein HW405_984, partial [Candidatus Berkelbacteria bacterium]|nr:hypothetical protein [Candidatus Berkelbacteria bacterium]
RAAVLFESGRLEDSRDEVYDIKTELDNYTPAEYPEVSDRTQELLTLYEAIKKEIAQEIEVKENLPPFETIRNIAVAELGPVDTLSYQEALVQMQKIAEQEGISNPLLIIVVQDASMQEFVLNQAEAEFQWEGLAEYYEDDKELSMPVALVVDGSKHHF